MYYCKIFNNEKTFLAIELENNADPQNGINTIIHAYKWIKIRKGNLDLNQYPIESPFLLLMVVPELTETLHEKFIDLEQKLKYILSIDENKMSTLTDFEICEKIDFEPTLKRLLKNNGISIK